MDQHKACNPRKTIAFGRDSSGFVGNGIDSGLMWFGVNWTACPRRVWDRQ